ncbi:WecB/TagA/CpsF family glycosyltransferase [Chitinibacter sp. SCUT-21]|uniref:WecB/TagA/CpsF family glycosyltransferase n=1 Tax=Chitinibacter sp. SCUT-21 TaxID=2970891 RepID=UPI0035A69B87
MSKLATSSYRLCAPTIAKLSAQLLSLLLWPLARNARFAQWQQTMQAIGTGQRNWIGSTTGADAGLISSYRLHVRMAMALDDEAEWDTHDQQSRSWRFDLALILRYGWSLLLGKKASLTENRWPLLGLWLDNLRHAQILDQLQQWQSQPHPRRIAFVNPHCANLASKDQLYRGVLNSADLLLPDGSGVLLASRILKTPLQENTNGTDLFPILCKQWQQQGAKLFLLGGRNGVAEEVARHLLQRYPGLHIAGTQHGYYASSDTPEVLNKIRHSQADVLVVAMGVPLQDTWIARHQAATGVKLAIGVGGLFDFLSGRIPRAPVWLRELGLEWCWRLIQEPKRMWQRYLLGNFTFLARVMRQKLQHAPQGMNTPRISTRSEPLSTSAAQEQALLLTDYALWQADDAAGTLLTPLLGHSLLELTVIRLVEQGVKLIHLFADEAYSAINQQLGNGERWGIEIRYYLTGQRLQTRRRMAALSLPEHIWLVAPGCLPQDPLVCAEQCQWEVSDGVWSGWAYIKSKRLKLALDQSALPLPMNTQLFNGLSLCNPQQLNAALPELLKKAPPYIPDFQEVQHQVWLAPGVICEKNVTLVGPLVIGRHCLLRAGCKVGPNVVIGESCVLDKGVDIHNSILKPFSYIAPQMSIAHSLVGNRQLQLVRDDTVLRFKAEECLIDDMGKPLSQPSWFERVQAGLAIAWLTVQQDRQQPERWQNVINRLHQVMAGECHLIGLPTLPNHNPLERKNLRLGALRLSELQAETLPAQGISRAEQDCLTDLYGAAVPQNLSWKKLHYLTQSLQRADAHFAIRTSLSN